jgi:hypothetical protein
MLRVHAISHEELENLVRAKEGIRFSRSPQDPSSHLVTLPISELTVHEADYLADSLSISPRVVSVAWDAAPLYLRRVVGTYPELLTSIVGEQSLDAILILWELPDVL